MCLLSFEIFLVNTLIRLLILLIYWTVKCVLRYSVDYFDIYLKFLSFIVSRLEIGKFYSHLYIKIFIKANQVKNYMKINCN